MTRQRPKRTYPHDAGGFSSALKWLALMLLTASLWILILTDSISQNKEAAIATATSLSAVLLLRVCYLLNLARINLSGSNALVDELDGVEFEHFCAAVLKKNGFRSVSVTKSSGDFGADITAADHLGNIWVFQCKRYASNIGNTPIQEVSAAKQHYNAQCAAVITNRHFTPAARQLAEENDVLLIEREKLFKMNKRPSKNTCRKLCKAVTPTAISKGRTKISGIIILDDHPDD